MGQWISNEWRAIDRSADSDNIKDITLDNSQDHDDGTDKSAEHGRLRILKEDPRSPTLSINRTPIEVLATPDSKEEQEYSPADIPDAGHSPTVGLLTKKNKTATASELHRKLIHRMPIPKMQSYENDAHDDTA